MISEARKIGRGRDQLTQAAKARKRRLLNDRFHFQQGCDFELARVIRHLRTCDGIGSGAEAAAWLERREHRR
jgi:hypothetical protein